MQNLVVVSDIVSAHAGVPKKFRRTPGLTHCGQGHRLTPTNKHATCGTVPNLVALCQTGVGRDLEKFGGRWGPTALTPRNMLLLACVTMPNSVILGLTVRA